MQATIQKMFIQCILWWLYFNVYRVLQISALLGHYCQHDIVTLIQVMAPKIHENKIFKFLGLDVSVECEYCQMGPFSRGQRQDSFLKHCVRFLLFLNMRCLTKSKNWMLPNIGIQKVSVSIPAVAINAKIKTIITLEKRVEPAPETAYMCKYLMMTYV